MEFYRDVGVVAEEGAALDKHAYGEGTCLIGLLVAQIGEIAEDDITQDFCLCVVVNTLVGDKRGNLHLLLTVELECVGGAFFSFLTADDVVVAQVLNHFLHLVLDIQARRIDIVDEQRCDIVDTCREKEFVGG